jgi:hypothetical protein
LRLKAKYKGKVAVLTEGTSEKLRNAIMVRTNQEIAFEEIQKNINDLIIVKEINEEEILSPFSPYLKSINFSLGYIDNDIFVPVYILYPDSEGIIFQIYE